MESLQIRRIAYYCVVKNLEGYEQAFVRVEGAINRSLRARGDLLKDSVATQAFLTHFHHFAFASNTKSPVQRFHRTKPGCGLIREIP